MDESSLYVVVYSFKLNKSYWKLEEKEKRHVLQSASLIFSDVRKKMNHLKLYTCSRNDADILFWGSARNAEGVQLLKHNIQESLGEFGYLSYSLVSIYEPSPYLHKGKQPENVFDQDPLKHFVAYPMSKTPEWYLIPYDERKKIMEEHIRMATTNPENEGIRSFTTYSFGLGDQEFVVMYEVDDLIKWSHVTGKLREATARKWIIKEEPIFVGNYIDSLDQIGVI